jgi:hypothetical protein
LSLADSNPLPNGDFSSASQITGWRYGFTPSVPGTLSWNVEDASGSPASGSLELDINNSAPGVNGNGAISKCFGVRPNATYTYGGHSRVSVGSGNITFFCATFSDNVCITAATYLTPYPTMSNGTAWSTAAGTGGTLPANAEYAMCRLIFVRTDGSSLASALFDNLYFDSASADHIFANGFEGPAGF